MAIRKERTAETRIRRRAFRGRPAIIRSGNTVIDFFPSVLADVVNKQASRPRLECEGEGIAQAQRPDCAIVSGRGVEERIVAGNGAVRVNPKYFSKKIG